MARVSSERLAAHIEGDFVIFLIGIRINKPWNLHRWLPAITAMPKMLKELDALPSNETGFLGHTGLSMGVIFQYWRSFDHLESYTRSKEHAHFPAWAAFNKRMKSSRYNVGIWHETYQVKAGQYEAVYSGMPPFGLGKASELVPATGSRSEARMRLKG
jgi:hypothetical protein